MQQNHINLVTAIASAILGVSSLIAAELPAEYRRVDYVETQGNQWIDTGYYPGPQTIVEGDVQMVGTFNPSDGGVPFGAQDADSYFRVNYANNNADRFLLRFGPTTLNPNFTDLYGAAAVNGKRVKIGFDANTKTFFYGGVNGTVSAALERTLTTPLGIGGVIKSVGDPVLFDCFSMRIYGWKIWTGTTLERDYVPCVRKQDNVAGLYDLRNGVFKPSAGDPFIAEGGKIKSVLEFPGKAVTDCITFGYCPSLSSFSASAWVKNVTPGLSEAGGTYVGVIFSQGAQGANPGFACSVSSKSGETYSLNCQVRRSLEDFKSVTTDWTAHAKDGKWHLVTVTYDKSSGLCCLYVDAEFKNSITQSTLTPISEQRFCIGARADGASVTGFPVKGNVAEVSLWDRVLKPTEIKKMLYGQLSGKEAGLLDYWPLTGPYDDLTFKGPIDCVDNGNTRHDGTYGTGVNVIGGKVGFWPKPGMAILLY